MVGTVFTFALGREFGWREIKKRDEDCMQMQSILRAPRASAVQRRIKSLHLFLCTLTQVSRLGFTLVSEP